MGLTGDTKWPTLHQTQHIKGHVEFLGPNGLVKSDKVCLALYGMEPDAEYEIRTYVAEEIYIIPAGDVD